MQINHDIDGEFSVLGSCLLLESCLFQSCQALNPDSFFDTDNQIIFKTMQELYKEGSEVNFETLVSRLKTLGTFEKVRNSLAKVNSLASNTTFNANLKNILINQHKRRISEFLFKLSTNFEEKSIHDIAEACNNYFNNTSQVKTYTISDISEAEFWGSENFETWIEKRYLDYQNGKVISGYSTGFFELDQKINGINPGHYIIIGGSPGSGKTTLLLQIMKNLMQTNIKCGFISLEMTREQAFAKMLCDQTGYNFDKIINCKFNNKGEFLKVLDAKKQLQLNKNLFIQDAQVDNLMALRSRIKYLVEVLGVQVLFIDYVTLIRNAVSSGNPVEAIQGISFEIRNILNQLRVPGLIVSQLNRSGSEGQPPEKHHLYGSGQLEKDAHEILLLHPDSITKERTLFIRKNRFGIENVSIKFTFKEGIFQEKPCF